MRFRVIKNGAGMYRVQKKHWWGWQSLREPRCEDPKCDCGDIIWESKDPRDATDRIDDERQRPARELAAVTWTVIEEMSE